MQGVKVGVTPCHRWALDLANAGEISISGQAIAYKEAICLLGGKCTYPGCSVTATKHYMLTIAHRYGDGGEHRKRFANSYNYTVRIGGVRASPSNDYYHDILVDIKEGRGNRYILLCENHHKETDEMIRREKRLAKRSALHTRIR